MFKCLQCAVTLKRGVQLHNDGSNIDFVISQNAGERMVNVKHDYDFIIGNGNQTSID